MLDDLNDIHPLFYGAPSSTEFKNYAEELLEMLARLSVITAW